MTMDASHIILFVTGLLIGVVLGWYLIPVEDDWPDEEPTLQVQNRHGDSRPVR